MRGERSGTCHAADQGGRDNLSLTSAQKTPESGLVPRRRHDLGAECKSKAEANRRGTSHSAPQTLRGNLRFERPRRRSSAWWQTSERCLMPGPTRERTWSHPTPSLNPGDEINRQGERCCVACPRPSRLFQFLPSSRANEVLDVEI